MIEFKQPGDTPPKHVKNCCKARNRRCCLQWRDAVDGLSTTKSR